MIKHKAVGKYGERDGHCLPAIVRSNQSIVVIKIRTDDAIYSSFLSSLLSFWVLCK